MKESLDDGGFGVHLRVVLIASSGAIIIFEKCHIVRAHNQIE